MAKCQSCTKSRKEGLFCRLNKNLHGVLVSVVNRFRLLNQVSQATVETSVLTDHNVIKS